MIRNLLKTSVNLVKFRPLSSGPNVQIEKKIQDHNVVDTRLLPDDNNFVQSKSAEDSVLEKCEEDISHVAPYLRPSFNFAAYANTSHTLQQLVKLGVKLYKLEKQTEVASYVLSLDFEKDIKKHLMFFINLGLDTEHLANLIEKNPFIFKEDLETLQIRINYLKSKKFTDEMVTRVLQDNPMWLSISTQDIDQKLGFFQKTFGLTGNQVRRLAAKKPRLITYDSNHLKQNFFVLKEEMGFSTDEMKQILLHTPKLFMKSQHNILKTFEYIHNEMKIPLETIAQTPNILTCREFRIKQRHLFLEKLGKTQFDPKKPNYISLMALVSGSDGYFATTVAGSTIQAFNSFLKTL